MKTLLQEKVGRALRDLRIRKNISQEELSEKSGLHRTYIGSVERGERNVSLLNIVKLCQALEIKVSDLFKEIEL